MRGSSAWGKAFFGKDVVVPAGWGGVLSGFVLNECGIASARILLGVNLPGAAVAARDQNEHNVLCV